MSIVAFLVGLSLIAVILWDAFETVVLPRRVLRRLGMTRLFYRTTWRLWSSLARVSDEREQQEAYLGLFGPLSLLLLLLFWAASLVIGFGLIHWAFREQLAGSGGSLSFGKILYYSGTTFF